MSIDINVFTNDIHSIEKDKFEEYCITKGINSTIHPRFDIDDQTGFLPFKLHTGIIDNSLEDKQFLTGFELCINSFDYKKEFKLNNNNYIFNNEVDNIIKGCSYIMTISISSQDSFELLVAYAFCGYVEKYCGGIVFDCESGEIVKNVDNVISDIVEFLKEQFKKKELRTHSFEGWS